MEGELYEVDDAVLKKLDQLEQHPDVYARKKTVVINKEGKAMVYMRFMSITNTNYFVF